MATAASTIQHIKLVFSAGPHCNLSFEVHLCLFALIKTLQGQLKDDEPEEDGVAEQDTENLIDETDEQTENNDTVDE